MSKEKANCSICEYYESSEFIKHFCGKNHFEIVSANHPRGPRDYVCDDFKRRELTEKEKVNFRFSRR